MGRKSSGGQSAKREAILDAARALFLEHGFASTSVDAVTAAAGVSKPTVYSHFPTKVALLEGVVQREATAARPGVPAEYHPTGDPRGDLERVARALATLALAPETLAWDRMMAGEARRMPELGRIFSEYGPRRTIATLTEFFRALAESGGLDIPDPPRAAEFFFGMVVGVPLLRAQLTGAPDPEDSAPGRCREVADRFLRAYAPGKTSK